jgi:hypothetical protein
LQSRSQPQPLPSQVKTERTPQEKRLHHLEQGHYTASSLDDPDARHKLCGLWMWFHDGTFTWAEWTGLQQRFPDVLHAGLPECQTLEYAQWLLQQGQGQPALATIRAHQLPFDEHTVAMAIRHVLSDDVALALIRDPSFVLSEHNFAAYEEAKRANMCTRPDNVPGQALYESVVSDRRNVAIALLDKGARTNGEYELLFGAVMSGGINEHDYRWCKVLPHRHAPWYFAKQHDWAEFLVLHGVLLDGDFFATVFRYSRRWTEEQLTFWLELGLRGKALRHSHHVLYALRMPGTRWIEWFHRNDFPAITRGNILHFGDILRDASEEQRHTLCRLWRVTLPPVHQLRTHPYDCSCSQCSSL